MSNGGLEASDGGAQPAARKAVDEGLYVGVLEPGEHELHPVPGPGVAAPVGEPLGEPAEHGGRRLHLGGGVLGHAKEPIGRRVGPEEAVLLVDPPLGEAVIGHGLVELGSIDAPLAAGGVDGALGGDLGAKELVPMVAHGPGQGAIEEGSVGGFGDLTEARHLGDEGRELGGADPVEGGNGVESGGGDVGGGSGGDGHGVEGARRGQGPGRLEGQVGACNLGDLGEKPLGDTDKVAHPLTDPTLESVESAVQLDDVYVEDVGPDVVPDRADDVAEVVDEGGDGGQLLKDPGDGALLKPALGAEDEVPGVVPDRGDDVAEVVDEGGDGGQLVKDPGDGALLEPALGAEDVPPEVVPDRGDDVAEVVDEGGDGGQLV
ncbi:hypothetical protein ES703_66977 [subsurface metagenome]